MKQLNILIVDDEQGYLDEIGEFLNDCGFTALTADTPVKALAVVNQRPVDIAIVDLKLPQMSGIELMRRMKELDSSIAIIMISGHGDIDSVVEAMRAGANDYFAKPFNLADIRISIERTRKFLDLSRKLDSTQNVVEVLRCTLKRDGKHPLVAESEAMKTIVQQMRQVASQPCFDVLITGESGTGKELVARGIHHLDETTNGVFYDINCTAIPDTLFESEFFGHEKHAFTGAQASRKGCFELANGGTLFLDEIGDMPLSMQAKLLRALEERHIRRIGAQRNIPLSLRVIASTNRDLRELIQNGQFRQDLYFRLNRFGLHISPLRKRTEDIPLLVDFHLRHAAEEMKRSPLQVTQNVYNRLVKYAFPGNVRELRNMVEKAYILAGASDTALDDRCFPDIFHCDPEEIHISDGLNLQRLENIEQKMIKTALDQASGNKTRAAQLLGITRTSLNRRIAKYFME